MGGSAVRRQFCLGYTARPPEPICRSLHTATCNCRRLARRVRNVVKLQSAFSVAFNGHDFSILPDPELGLSTLTLLQ
jgi:hypothetical protein